MDDRKIRQDIIDALDWDPSVDSANIGVAVNKGVAVLTGHVANYPQKLAAVRIAKGVKGVIAIADDIVVRYPSIIAFDDEDIAARAVQALELDVLLPKKAIEVRVSKGWVTLSGQLEWDYQRRAAEADVRKLGGVVGVSNQIALERRATPADVSHRILEALKRDAEVEASRVKVQVAEGKVTLQGNVRTWRERDAIERAAWAAPGVHAVEDQVRIG